MSNLLRGAGYRGRPRMLLLLLGLFVMVVAAVGLLIGLASAGASKGVAGGSGSALSG